jgi:hypothetical protein
MEPKMNWNDPAERLALLIEVDHDEYVRRALQHIKDTTVEAVNDRGIRLFDTPFGSIYMVESAASGFRTLEEAREFARALPVKVS